MTDRLYYETPRRTQFTAEVVEALTWEGRPAVVLDRTLFYPAAGAQPADRGTLNAAQVLDVVEVPRGEGAFLAHILSQPIVGSSVTGQIDWDRRFDHMQQHTGQHLLSAAFDQVIGSATISFHMGESSSTLDLDAAGLDTGDVLPVELLVNSLIWEDRPVTTRLVKRREAVRLTRKPLPEISGDVRLVEIGGGRDNGQTTFDANPCGGTHVARTGEIGLVKVTGLEHRGTSTRIEFLCGRRALRDYQGKHSALVALGLRLTVGIGELDEAVQRLQDENQALRRAERGLRNRIIEIESEQLLESASTRGAFRIVGRVWQNRPSGELQSLARKLTELDDVVALLFTVADRTHFCVARGAGVALDVRPLVQQICESLGGGGGGRPEVAQGSAPRAEVGDVRNVLQTLERTVTREG